MGNCSYIIQHGADGRGGQNVNRNSGTIGNVANNGAMPNNVNNQHVNLNQPGPLPAIGQEIQDQVY